MSGADPKPARRAWAWWKALLITVVVTGFPTAYFYYDLVVRPGLDAVSGSQDVNRIEFNLLNGCAAGDLGRRVAGFFDDRPYRFADGADQLRICATISVSAPPEGLAREIAETFKGCLAFQSHDRTLKMLPNPDAICVRSVGTGVVYFCDGRLAAATRPPNRRVAVAELAPCRADFP